MQITLNNGVTEMGRKVVFSYTNVSDFMKLLTDGPLVPNRQSVK